jgi:DNA-binding IclR family transcriptional regulator
MFDWPIENNGENAVRMADHLGANGLDAAHRRSGGGAQSVARAAAVLRAVGRAGTAQFSVLVRDTGLPNPTLRRLLVSLMEAGLVEQETATGHYRLGAQAYVLGQLAGRHFRFHDLARDGLRRLAQVSGDSAFLSAREGLSTVCLHREEGRYPIRTHVLNVGDRHPLGMGAAALAVLAALPEALATKMLTLNTQAIAAACPELQISQLADLVVQARATGVALNPGLVFPGSWAIAAAVRAPSGEVVGAITIAAIEQRMTPERQIELAVPLQEEVRRLEFLMADLEADMKLPLAAE